MLAHIHQLGGGLVVITPVSAVDPGFGGGIGAPIDPGFGGGRPPHVGGGPIYHPGHPDHGLPSQPVRPDNSLPGGPGHPDQRPPGQPPHVPAGTVLVLVRDPAGVWHYATLPANAPAPTPLPVPPTPAPAPAPKS